MNFDYNDLLNDIGDMIYMLQDKVQISNFGCAYETSKKQLKQVQKNKSLFHSSILEFYSTVESYDLQWKSSSNSIRTIGYIEVLSFKQVLRNRYFADWAKIEEKEDRLIYINGESTIIDFNSEFYHLEILPDAYGTGYFVGELVIYYHGNQDDFQSMDINIEGYLQLLAKTYGLIYWQKVIVDIKNKNWESEEYQEFESNMKVVNSDFKLSEFETFYNSIRLNRL